MVPAKDEASALTGQPALQTSLAAWHVKASWLQAGYKLRAPPYQSSDNRVEVRDLAFMQ
jgi:hypothetical protein